VSNFRPVKRLLDVVRIFAGVRKELKAKLILVGDGPDSDAAQREAANLNVKRDVRFFGRVDDIADLLRGADLFLLPSETESFGLAALEAMACGVPVVASAAGGIPEVVVDGETGFLAPVGDVAAMTERALEVLRDPVRLEALRRGSVTRAAAFAAENVVPQYEQVYEDVLRD
jgi:N-acetyl-alpha-D-glucosaminyl L-malate synthase BshA